MGTRGCRARGRGPDRCGKVTVIGPARNDMPMQMRHDVTEAGKIDLVRAHQFAHGGFGCGDDIEQVTAFDCGKVGHLSYMLAPDDATKAWKSRALATANADDAAPVILPEDFAARGVAQFA